LLRYQPLLNRCFFATASDITGTDALGQVSPTQLCQQPVNNDHLPMFFEPTKRPLIGSHFLMSYRVATFNHQGTATTPIHFYFDGEWIFFSTSIQLNDRLFTGQNACLDTGAQTSYLSDQLYRDLRPSLKNEELKTVTTEGGFGQTQTMARVIKTLHLSINDASYTLEDVPIFVRSPHLYQCSIVIGIDVLQYLTRLDTHSRQLTFNLPN
jgi:hypothetical protein